jgi:phosphatidylinositol-3-phosphatase
MLFKNRLPNLVRRFLAPVLAMVGCHLVAATATAGPIGSVFVIDMENHNFTQPSSDTTAPQQLLGNPAAPYLNNLITPGNPNAAQVSYASAYHNVLATPSGDNASIHPSLPNYLWQEAGTNNGVLKNNQPFGPGGANQGNAPSLTALLQANGISWKSYQEDTDINTNTGQVLPKSQWTVPLQNSSGTFTSGTNPYNGSNQYNFATKHDGSLYFNATNGGNDTTPSNPLVSHYAPLQQLQTDLASNSVARYNLITPDQYNDMHSALSGGFTYQGVHYTGDQAAVAQGDNFLSIIIPQIMASQAYKANGTIVIWYDETEGTNQNDFSHTLAEIVISPLAKGNAYDSTLDYTHSSDLKSWEELFGVYAGGQFLGDANAPGTNDLSDLFVAGALAGPVPEPRSLVIMSMGLGIGGLYGLMRFLRRKAA